MKQTCEQSCSAFARARSTYPFTSAMPYAVTQVLPIEKTALAHSGETILNANQEELLMPANKIKFEMSLKELTFKFEGDYEQGQRLQLGINKTLSDFAKLQGTAAGFDDSKLIDAAPPAARITRRRKKKNEQHDVKNDGVQTGASEGDAVPSDTQRRSGGESPTKLLTDLRRKGFFAEARTTSEVVSELQRSGHTSIQQSDLTAPLIRLCKREVLKRDKPPGEDSWNYTAGPTDE